ncbi:MAG: VWA domain-containing protein [Saprospiraceae bacterium]|nr:VWA domain-containing protein [Saprospiraceae bacterium]
MFRFESISAIYLLALIPVMMVIFLWGIKLLNKRKSQFGKPELIERLMSFQTGKSNRVRFGLLILAVLFIILAATNPQWGFKKDKIKVNNSDIFIALDISSSMNTTDINPSRIEKAKKFVESLIEARKGDQIGLIFFAGSAYLQMPLTYDYAAAELFVKSANTEMAGTQGTAIGEAINLAQRSINTKEQNQRALIIISDGEDHDEEALDQAKNAVSDGWNIFTIGVGTAEGGYVPVLRDGREEFKTDDEGNPVKSVLNRTLLSDLAENGHGEFYMLEDGHDIINDLNGKIEKLRKRATEVRSFSEFKSYYQYLLAIGLFLLITDFFISPFLMIRKHD